MKKIILLLLFACVFMAGCGSKPDYMSDHDYEAIKEVINLTDKVLDGKMEAKDAESLIGFYYDQIPKGDINQSLIRSEIQLLRMDVYEYGLSIKTAEDVIEVRNRLAQRANLKSR